MVWSLAQRMKEAARMGRAELYWDDIVYPFFTAIWPSENTMWDQAMQLHIETIILASRERFPTAVELFAPWLRFEAEQQRPHHDFVHIFIERLAGQKDFVTSADEDDADKPEPINYLNAFPEDGFKLLAARLTPSSHSLGKEEILRQFLEENKDTFKELNQPDFGKLSEIASS